MIKLKSKLLNTIKKHQGFSEDSLNKQTINISINSIKYINGMNKVQIFSI